MTITSKDNEKLKLVRRLRERKHRRREGLLVAEGEDLLKAGLSAGREPELVLSAAGSGLGGDEVAAELLGSISTLGSGTRVISVWRQLWSEPRGPVCVYLHGVADPGNVGALIRTADALVDGAVVLGPGCADPYSPKAVRASMGALFGVALVRCAVRDTPEPRAGMVARGGSWPPAARPATLCLGAEREGLAGEVAAACSELWSVPLAGGADSLGVAAAAAIALERISSAAAEGGA